jgi:putative heme-binding domain-containing protein
MAIRFRAAVALAQVDLESGAQAAAVALAASSDKDDPGPVIEALLIRKNAPEKLAAALAKENVNVDTAKRILRAMYLAGRNDAPLANVVSKFAGLDAMPKPPTPEEMRQLIAEAQTKGDAARGERVFRRADLGCVKCHAVNKAGGNIGPDLGPIGGSSPIDYIITSILDPNASIKEEYLTKVISTTTGTLVTGVVHERTKNQVVLKDATGKIVRIPVADIDDEANGKSLMPEGVTRILTRPELIDLIRFVSELGKPGAYAIPSATTIQRWKRLRDAPAALRDGIPNREVVRDSLLNTDPAAWESVFAMVNGTLPLEELHRPSGPDVTYLQGEIQMVSGGRLDFLLQSNEPVTFWIDEEPFEQQSMARINLVPGRHTITVRIGLNGGRPAGLRVEVRRPTGSAANFEVLHQD